MPGIQRASLRPRYHSGPTRTTVDRWCGFRTQSLVILRGQLIINIPNKRHPHLRRVVPTQNVANKVRLNLHLHHLQRPAEDPAVEVGEP